MLKEHLPLSTAERDQLIMNAIGSEDPTGMEINGVGGGISSTSKVAIISPSTRPGFDVNYLFGQVPIRGGGVDWSGSCGNLSAAVGHFAVHAMGLADSTKVPGNTKETKRTWSVEGQGQQHQVRVWQENLGHEIIVHVPGEEQNLSCSIAGVPGKHPSIYVELVDPNNGGNLLPTGNPTDKLTLLNGAEIEATLVFSANPTVFVNASDIGLSGEELPHEFTDYSNEFEPQVMHLLRQGSERMGISYSPAVRLAWVAQPESREYNTTGDSTVNGASTDIVARITTEGRVHHAFTGTGAINLACARQIPGSIPWRTCSKRDESDNSSTLLHPGGTTTIRATVKRLEGAKGYTVTSAGMMRSARVLMDGLVNTSGSM